MKNFARPILCLMISFTLVEAPVARANMISTTEALHEYSRTEAESHVTDFLKREDVKQELIKLGVGAEEATLRLASLSDSELKQMSKQIEAGQAGGDIIGILTVVLLVLLIIYLAKRI